MPPTQMPSAISNVAKKSIEVKESIPSQSYGVSPAIWAYTECYLMHDTIKHALPYITAAKQPGGEEGWVNLGCWLYNFLTTDNTYPSVNSLSVICWKSNCFILVQSSSSLMSNLNHDFVVLSPTPPPYCYTSKLS